MSATTPEMCGVAMLVPLMQVYYGFHSGRTAGVSANWPASAVDPVVMPCGLRAAQMRVPGAVMVGVRLLSGAPTDENVESWRFFWPAATQITRPPQYVLSVFGALDVVPLLTPSFPAAKTTGDARRSARAVDRVHQVNVRSILSLERFVFGRPS